MAEIKEKKTKRTLQEITQHLQELAWRIDDAEGVLEDGVEEELDGLTVELAVKVNAVLWVSDQQAAMADKMEARAKSLAAKAKSLRGDHDRLRAYVLRCLIQADIQRMSTKDYPVVAIYKVPDKVEVVEEIFLAQHKANAELCNHQETWKPRLDPIKKLLQAGEEVAGATLLTGRVRLGVK